jgi:hypothetical protein
VVRVRTFSGTRMDMQVQAQIPVAELGLLDSYAKHSNKLCHIHEEHSHFL